MIKRLLLMFVLLISLLYLLGCTKQVTPPTPPAKPETTPITEQKAITTEDKAADIESGISDASVLNDDLALGDLENIDQEIEDVTW